MADLSEGTGDRSVLVIHRFIPWNSRHSHGETNVTVGAVAAALQRNATATIVNVSRVIAGRPYHFLIAVWRAKEAQSDRVKYREII
jgi:hypothetical protein